MSEIDEELIDKFLNNPKRKKEIEDKNKALRKFLNEFKSNPEKLRMLASKTLKKKPRKTLIFPDTLKPET